MTKTNIHASASALALIAKGNATVSKGQIDLIDSLCPLVESEARYDVKLECGHSFSFALAEYSRPIFKDGEQLPAQKVQGAKFDAFCEAVGAEPNRDLMSTFLKCLDSAIGLKLAGVGAIVKGEDGKRYIQLPLGKCSGIQLGTPDKRTATFKKLEQSINFGRKKKLTGEALLEAINREEVICDASQYFVGGKTPTLTQAMSVLTKEAQAQGLIPAKTSRVTRAGNPVDDTRKAIDTLNKALITINRSDESPIALTDRDDATLREIAQNIAAYFAI